MGQNWTFYRRATMIVYSLKVTMGPMSEATLEHKCDPDLRCHQYFGCSQGSQTDSNEALWVFSRAGCLKGAAAGMPLS